MPYKDPEKRRAYHRSYQRAYSKAHRRDRDWATINRVRRGRGDGSALYFGTLDQFDEHVRAGLCIWKCMTARPCKKPVAAPGRLFCVRHGKAASSPDVVADKNPSAAVEGAMQNLQEPSRRGQDQ